MKIIFLGTRGYIDIRTARHYRHTSTLLINQGKKIMIDCGIDWSKKVFQIKPDAIFITHAHPDHSWGLKEGSPCPVYATPVSWDVMNKFKIKKENRIRIKFRQPIKLFGITIEPFEVIHSILAPAVGYRISQNRKAFFLVPDLVWIKERKEAFSGINFYIGDGATINRPMIRKKNNELFGHTTISAQMTWCKKEKVPLMIITHCGSEIVKNDGRKIRAKINKLANERGIKAKVAYDGMVLKL